MGDDPPFGPGPGGFLASGGLTDHREESPEALEQQTGLPPPLYEAMWEAGFEVVEVYVLRRQNMVAQYIAIQPILNLC